MGLSEVQLPLHSELSLEITNSCTATNPLLVPVQSVVFPEHWSDRPSRQTARLRLGACDVTVARPGNNELPALGAPASLPARNQDYAPAGPACQKSFGLPFNR